MFSKRGRVVDPSPLEKSIYIHMYNKKNFNLDAKKGWYS